MKVAISALLATVLGLSLVGGQAEAAKAKKKAAKVKAAAKKETSAPALPAKVEAAATPAPAPTAAAPAQTTAAPIATAVTEAAPKRWAFMLDYWVEGYMAGVNRSSAGSAPAGTETMMATPQARVTYKITDTASVAAGMDWEHSFGSQGTAEEGGHWKSYDSFVQIAHSKLATLGPVNIRGYIRPYLPTSEASQNPQSGRYFALRGNLSAKSDLGAGFALSYTLEPRYFAAKNASFKEVQDDGSIKWKPTEDYRIKHWLGLDYEAGKFSGYLNAGIKSQMYNQDSDPDSGKELVGKQKDQFYNEASVGYQLIENFALNVGYYQEENNFRDNNAWIAFDEKTMLYFVEGVVTF